MLRVARSITANGRDAVRLAKRAVRAGQDVAIEAGCEIEANMFAASFGDEQRKRMTAFLENRGKK